MIYNTYSNSSSFQTNPDNFRRWGFIRPFVRSCPDFRAFIRPFVRSCPDFRAFFLVSRPCKFERTTTPSCVHLGLDISTFRLGPQPGMAVYWMMPIFKYTKNSLVVNINLVWYFYLRS